MPEKDIPWESYEEKEFSLECDKCGKLIEIGAKFYSAWGVYVVHSECKDEMTKRIHKYYGIL